MARLTMQRFMELQEMGREPISLPESIYFGGNIILQKTPGNHHLPKYRKTGTYDHPQLRAMRKREALDMAKRLINNKLQEVSLRKVGGMAGLQARLAEFGLKIDEGQMEVALMNANALEQDGNAKKMYRESQKMLEMAKLGIEYKPMEAETTPYTAAQQVKDVIKAKTKKLPADMQLDSLKGDDERDGNKLSVDEQKELAEGDSAVVETPEGDLELNIVETK